MGRLDNWCRGLVAAAGLLGASAIVIGAAGAHEGGGDLARLASIYLLVHAATILGIVAVALRSGSAARMLLLAAMAQLVGVSAFSAELSVVAFTGSHAFRLAAPVGGVVMIAGWLLLFVAGLRWRP